MNQINTGNTHETVDLDAVRYAYSPKSDANEIKENFEYDMV